MSSKSDIFTNAIYNRSSEKISADMHKNDGVRNVPI